MATYTITQVYAVRAESPLAAQATLDAWRESGTDLFEVRLEFESVRLTDPEDTRPAKPGNPWLAEAKRQLLGGEDRPSQPARKNGQS